MSKSRSLTRNSRIVAEVDGGPKGRAGLVASVLLHAGIIGATLFTLTHARLDIVDEAPPVVPVDLVTIAQKTNLAPTVTVRPKVVQQQVQPPQVDQLQTQNVPAIHEQSEPAPDEAASEPVLKKPTPLPTPKARPQVQPAQQTQPKKASPDDLSALLNKLTAPSAAPPNARVAARAVKGFGAQNAMTADLSDALSSQIKPCWSPPVGAPRADELVVDFDLFLNSDGSVARPPQLTASSRAAAASDPYTAAAADAARRAIFTCAPYKLPADRYSQWSEINPFHFDPRAMMGQ